MRKVECRKKRPSTELPLTTSIPTTSRSTTSTTSTEPNELSSLLSLAPKILSTACSCLQGNIVYHTDNFIFSYDCFVPYYNNFTLFYFILLSNLILFYNFILFYGFIHFYSFVLFYNNFHHLHYTSPTITSNTSTSSITTSTSTTTSAAPVHTVAASPYDLDDADNGGCNETGADDPADASYCAFLPFPFHKRPAMPMIIVHKGTSVMAAQDFV
ncbi:hypothetical protein AB5N19_07136 [Seiridium cardinale]